MAKSSSCELFLYVFSKEINWLSLDIIWPVQLLSFSQVYIEQGFSIKKELHAQTQNITHLCNSLIEYQKSGHFIYELIIGWWVHKMDAKTVINNLKFKKMKPCSI